MASSFDWTVRPFEGPDDREARRLRCLEMRAAGVGPSAVGRALEVSPWFVWSTCMTPEQRERQNRRHREARARTKDAMRVTVPCRGCGTPRSLGEDAARRLRQGKAPGLCRSCLNRRRRPVVLEDADAPLLTRAQVRVWAKRTLLAMSVEDRLAIASLDMPDLDRSRPARHAGTRQGARQAA